MSRIMAERGSWADPFSPSKERSVPGPKPRYHGPAAPPAKEIPAFMARGDIRASTKLVWLFLGISGKGQHTINIHSIGKKLGMSRSTVWRALLQLQDEGLIVWERMGVGGSGWDRHGNITIERTK